jgi:DNA-binding MarR family transcriptional regulator
MAEDLTPSGEKQMRKEQPSDPTSVEELAKAISTMNRFLSKFAAMTVFTEAKISVADWTVLMHLLETAEPRYPFIATFTGIADQRLYKLVQSLVEAGLISSTPSTDPARPNPVLSVTEAGRARLGAINNRLQPLLSQALKGSRNVLMAIQNRVIPSLMQMVEPGK